MSRDSKDADALDLHLDDVAGGERGPTRRECGGHDVSGMS
jgi:hypothetical protein